MKPKTLSVLWASFMSSHYGPGPVISPEFTGSENEPQCHSLQAWTAVSTRRPEHLSPRSWRELRSDGNGGTRKAPASQAPGRGPLGLAC